MSSGTEKIIGLADLDVLITRIYEDAVLGNLSQERYQKMSQSYEEEQERLKLEIEVTEEWVDQQMKLEDNLDAFLALTEKYVDVRELTPTIVNEFISNRIEKQCVLSCRYLHGIIWNHRHPPVKKPPAGKPTGGILPFILPSSIGYSD